MTNETWKYTQSPHHNCFVTSLNIKERNHIFLPLVFFFSSLLPSLLTPVLHLIDWLYRMLVLFPLFFWQFASYSIIAVYHCTGRQTLAEFMTHVGGYLKQNVYWHCSKTTTISPFIVGSHSWTSCLVPKVTVCFLYLLPPSFTSHSYLWYPFSSPLHPPFLHPFPFPARLSIYPLSLSPPPSLSIKLSLCLNGPGSSELQAEPSWSGEEHSVILFSLQTVFDLVSLSLSGENKACFLSCSGCGLSGRCGSQ